MFIGPDGTCQSEHDEDTQRDSDATSVGEKYFS